MIPKRNGRQLPTDFITTQDMGPPLGVTDANNESAEGSDRGREFR